MKVLQVISSNDNGGGGIHVLNTFSIKVNNFDNELCLIGEGPLLERGRENLKNFHQVPYYKYNKALIELINVNNYDIVNFHGARAVFTYMLIRKKINCKVAVTVQSDFRYDFKNNLFKYIIFTPLFRLGLKYFNNYICTSDYIKNLIEINKYCGSIYRINNGIDLSKIAITEESDLIRKNLDIPKEAFIYVCIARLHPVKNHIKLINAFAKINKQYEDTYLLLVGNGNLEETLEKKAKELGIEKKVIFLGYKKNTINYLNAADINMLVSYNEGGMLPLSVLEGFAVNKAVIMSNFFGIAKVLNKDYFYGVNQNSEEDIYDKMKKAIINNSTNTILGEKCHEIALKEFSIENFCKGYYEIYKDIMKTS
jgi:glycosyltransferase involved in cell wall biosynthesis